MELGCGVVAPTGFDEVTLGVGADEVGEALEVGLGELPTACSTPNIPKTPVGINVA